MQSHSAFVKLFYIPQVETAETALHNCWKKFLLRAGGLTIKALNDSLHKQQYKQNKFVYNLL